MVKISTNQLAPVVIQVMAWLAGGYMRHTWLLAKLWHINTLRPRQNGRHFADDTFNRIFVNKNIRIANKFSLKFVPKGPINNIPVLVQIMA